MTKGYTEWIHGEDGEYVGYITNCFGRLLYINPDFPDGSYERIRFKVDRDLFHTIKENCKVGRTFNKDELTLELL